MQSMQEDAEPESAFPKDYPVKACEYPMASEADTLPFHL
jgi:hypothetical protein